MTSGIYDRFKANLMNGVVDLEADTINVALCDGSDLTIDVTDAVLTDYIPVPNAAPELLVGATGYTAGGAPLANMVVTEATTTDWTADPLSWTSSTFTTYACLIYDITATSNLICFIDFGGPQTVTAGTFTIQWNASGIITLA